MRRKHLTPDDECRVLHEAYQFLFRKYNLGETLECTNQAAFENGEVPPSPGKYGGKRTFPKAEVFYYVNYVNVNYSVKNSTVDCKYLLYF